MASNSNFPPFELERYFAIYEFSAKYMLSASDCQGMEMKELLSMADAETKAMWETLSLGYTETRGSPVLRKEISKSLFHDKMDAERNIMVCAPEEGIFLTMMALLNPADHVVAICPAYQSLFECARQKGCEVTLWNFFDAADQQQSGNQPLTIDTDKLASLIRPNTKMLIINFPHNPTGSFPSRESWQHIIDIARNAGIILFSDEIYFGLEHANPVEHRLTSAAELYDRSIVLGGLSKAYSGAGLRMGWLVSQNADFIDAVANLKDYTTICPPAPCEVLAIIALRNGEQIRTRNMNIIKKNLGIAADFFSRHSHIFEYTPTVAGSLAFPKYKAAATGLSLNEFCDKVVRETGVSILPGTVYEGAGDDRFRLGLGRTNFEEAIRILEQFLQQWKQ